MMTANDKPVLNAIKEVTDSGNRVVFMPLPEYEGHMTGFFIESANDDDPKVISAIRALDGDLLDPRKVAKSMRETNQSVLLKEGRHLSPGDRVRPHVAQRLVEEGAFIEAFFRQRFSRVYYFDEERDRLMGYHRSSRQPFETYYDSVLGLARASAYDHFEVWREPSGKGGSDPDECSATPDLEEEMEEIKQYLVYRFRSLDPFHWDLSITPADRGDNRETKEWFHMAIRREDGTVVKECRMRRDKTCREAIEHAAIDMTEDLADTMEKEVDKHCTSIRGE